MQSDPERRSTAGYGPPHRVQAGASRCTAVSGRRANSGQHQMENSNGQAGAHE